MKIRQATYQDAPFIKLLLQDIGQQTSVSLLVSQFNAAFAGADHEVWVCEDDGMVIGFTVLHTLPRLGSEARTLVISQILVNGKSVSDLLKAHIDGLAVKRNCQLVTL